MEFWVGFQNLGLGFKNTEQRRKRKRKERMENGQIRVINPFIRTLGSGQPKPDPLSSLFGRWIQILMDLDQSNAPGALV